MKLNKVIFLSLILLLGVVSFCSGQTARERFQEILAEVAKGPSPEKKIEILINGSYELRRVAPRQALSLSNRAIILADRHKTMQGLAYASLGARQINLENYEGALETYQAALTFNQGAAKASSRAGNYKSLGHCYEQLLDYENSLSNFKNSLQLYASLKNDKEIASVNNRLGKIYFDQKNYQQALNSFEAALKVAKKLGNKSDIKTLENNIAICKTRLGSTTAAPAAGEQLQTLGFEEQFEIIRDSLIEARTLIERQEQELASKVAELMGKDTSLAQSQERVAFLSEVSESLARAKAQKERELILYLIIAIGAAGTILIIALLILRNNRIKQKSNRELAEKNVEILEEKQKTDELLLNILPEVVATELKATGKVKPKKYTDTTMLFTDFKGFTRLASSMSPEELISELNRCFEVFDDICARNNLEKIKTIGDAYMAVSGVPRPNPDHARDTVRAALEMQAFMKSWKKEKIAKGKPYWELRIGVHSGSVIAGVIGKHKFVYDIWGDAVNIASRMESSGEAWEVNISQQTHDLIQDSFSCKSRGKVPIKHKGPVDMYFVMGEKK